MVEPDVSGFAVLKRGTCPPRRTVILSSTVQVEGQKRHKLK